jgi:hypothetical protein
MSQSLAGISCTCTAAHHRVDRLAKVNARNRSWHIDKTMGLEMDVVAAPPFKVKGSASRADTSTSVAALMPAPMPVLVVRPRRCRSNVCRRLSSLRVGLARNPTLAKWQ